MLKLNEEFGQVDREANEFIVYWLPLMEQNPYNIVAFQTEVYPDTAKLLIDPAPDTLIRVFMAWYGTDIYTEMKELATKRNTKQPVTYPSAGSTFKRPEGHFAGKLVEDAGLKGVSVGGAEVSTLHSGFIINKGGATATDILELIALVQNRVYDEFGVELKPEVRIIG